MQTCELLRWMDTDDLKQRYEGTLVEYGGEWITVTTFDTPEKTKMIYFRNDKGMAKEVPFDWRQLNTERLPSRWYYRDGQYASFLSYIPARQWKRGYTGNNTRLFNPSGNLRFHVAMGKSFAEQAKQTVINHWTDGQRITERIDIGDAILSEDFCFAGLGLYFREHRVGMWNKTLNKLVLKDQLFLDEMRDLGIMHLLAKDEETKIVAKDAPKPDWITLAEQFKNMNLKIERNEEDPLIPTAAERAMMNPAAVNEAGAYHERVLEHNQQIRFIRAGLPWNGQEPNEEPEGN